MHKNVYAVVLAGGKGERFWPASRESRPKQLLSVVDRQSLIENTLERISRFIPKERILIITTKSQLRQMRNKLHSLERKNFFVEPYGKNTAICIGVGASILRNINPESVMVVLPIDHYIIQTEKFLKALSNAVEIASKTNHLITLGIKPNFAATGLGYIKTKDKSPIKNGRAKIFKVEKFIEKPDLKNARAFSRDKRYFWNSGIFIWKTEAILNEIKSLQPRMYSAIADIQKNIKKDKSQKRLARIYSAQKDISIDYAIMEKSDKVLMLEADFRWVDLGAWSSMSQVCGKDTNKNVICAFHKGVDSKENIIIGQPQHLLATVGVSNLIIVQTKDATLVCRKDKAEDIKKLVGTLKKERTLKRFL